MPDDHTTGATLSDRMMLAGMALCNGVLVIGPTHWGAAVRDRNGDIVSTSRARPQFGRALYGVPGLRGPARLAEMVAVLPLLQLALPQARLPLASARMVSTLIVTGVLTRQLRSRADRHGRIAATTAELATSSLSLAAMLAALSSADLARYHGAEHKAIGGYEQGIAAADASKEHERCGTHLAVPTLVVNAVAMQLARAVLPRSPGLAAAMGTLAGMAASTELARSMQRARIDHPDRTPRLQVLGMRLQSIASTREPDAEQLAVAHAALNALLEAEGAEPVAA